MSIDFEPGWMEGEHRALRESVGRFLDAEVAPREEVARKEGNMGRAIWKRMGSLGFFCMDVPEEYGGGGADFRSEAVVYEEAARRGLCGMNITVHGIVAHYLLNHGTEEQKRAYLPRMARGELIGGIAMTEPGAGSDLQGIRTRAQLVDGQYVIDGSKTFISNGALAGLMLVVCKTDETLGAKGMSILIVETEGAGGYQVGRVLDKIGQKAQDTAELFFDNVRVPAANLLGGEPGKGFYQLMGDLPRERTMVGIIAMGSMRGAYQATLDFVRDRRAFGRTVADFQNTKFKLAEMAATMRVGRTFIDDCVARLADGRLDAVTAAMAKLWLSEQQGKVVDECVQLHGGYGYMNEYLVGRLYIDARIQRIYGGTSEIMKEVISRAL